MARTPDNKLCRIPLAHNPLGQGLMLASLALLALGVVLVFSALASVSSSAVWYARTDVRQAIFAAVALLAMLVLWKFDYHRLQFDRRLRLPAVLLGLALVTAFLVYVPGIGHAVEGRYRWIRVGPSQYQIQFQPSEVLRLALVIFLASWLTRPSCNLRSFWRTFVPGVGLTMMCIVPVIKDDFGMSLLIILSGLVTLLLAGVPWYYLASLIPPGAAAFYVMVISKADRLNRMMALVNPWDMNNPSAYQPRQSLLAIINGGWTGTGLGSGLLKQGYLPERTTDFIFAIPCEELGFVGALLLLGLILMWIYQARKAAVTAPDQLGRVLAGSLGAVIAMQMVMHVSVASVALPPTGMSLPFVSAGGTSLVVMAGAVAIMVSVTASRYAKDAATEELLAAAPA
ncbi:MAG: Lipid II flippase FtsW [Planctomycetes bacterium ADurb.Bin126]|nr:MAG: Lipid II flippase FtsW [Planctomycetes bacterium ADurb.Bin126]HOD81652.1 FtsW/RodA/SpoVE family cell cycle protein [Phycisphaerae bacterium]HQL74783.1 FtsW/RodA/SpoVE family cell cycle protein [Phycisphaerae bacterium]